MADVHVEQVLEAAGISKEQITELKALAADAADFKTDKYTGTVKTAYETRLENDPEFLKKVVTLEKLPADVKKAFEKTVESGQYGRFMNETKEVLKSKGFTDDEINTLEKQGLKGFLNGSLDSYGKKVGTPEALTKLQQDLADALKSNKTLTDGQQKLIDDAINGEKSKSQLMLERITIRDSINEINGSKEGDKTLKFVVAPSIVAGPIHDGVKAKYTVVLNPETEKFELRQKAHPELHALDSAGKNITYESAAIAVGKELKLIVDEVVTPENRDKKIVKVNGEETDVAIPDYIKKQAGM